MSGSRGHNLRLGSHGCGISDERLAFEAVRAAVSKEMQHVREFVNSVGQVMGVKEYPDETLYGRAGTLYLLRLVRHWVQGSEGLVEPAIAEISNMILGNGSGNESGKGGWKWHGKQYLGTESAQDQRQQSDPARSPVGLQGSSRNRGLEMWPMLGARYDIFQLP